MAVSQLKDGRWICYYYIDKKRKVEYFGRGLDGHQKAEARDQELKEQGIIRVYKKQQPMAAGVTFGQLAQEYFSTKSQTELTPASADNLEYSLTATILPELGHLLAASLTYKCLDKYVEKRLKTQRTVLRGSRENKKEKPLFRDPPKNKIPWMISRSSVNRELCDVQAILNWAVQQKYLIVNPVIKHAKPKKDNQIIKPPTAKETRNIIAESAPHLIRTLTMSYFLGIRPGEQELFSLTWDDVNFEENTIFVISAKKNGLPYRDIPIHPDLLDDLKKWEKEDKGKPAREIITWKDKPIKSIKSAYKNAKRRAGVTRRIRLYDFRHAFATLMLAAGADLKTTSETLGHSRIDTTMKIYQHTSMALKRQEIVKLPSFKKPLKSDDRVVQFDDLKKKTQKARQKRNTAK